MGEPRHWPKVPLRDRLLRALDPIDSISVENLSIRFCISKGEISEALHKLASEGKAKKGQGRYAGWVRT